MKKEMKNEKTPNIEIYSYLNIRNRTLGKWYKESAVSPLPNDFVLTEEVILEALQLSEMKNKRFTIPFGAENKSYIRKKEKLSLKNCKRILDYKQKLPYSPAFCQKLETYLTLRINLTNKLFEKAKSQDFDEIEAFREIHNLDPVFADLIEFGNSENEGLYGELLGPVLDGLEEKYSTIYSLNLKEIEAKNNRKSQKQTQKQAEINLEESKRKGAEIQKQVEEKKKIENKKSAEKIRQEQKTANAEIKAKKNKERK